ncbi:hypothetical protein [Corallococcus macrosporus]|uniref:Uncharacterized protein n=1 Tax=Corallococcus macrosporus DSM 14697 TaxID=1189310 RepID=A0A250JM76_9BACT|nr:hypothetical protein [Corallococcus macrosporus]ATB44572.1 hypothetical protein MYMAC_000143 [Corallococcus macrosporus DSM 14697]
MAEQRTPKSRDASGSPQPDTRLREAMNDPETARRDAEDREVTNEAHRWGEEGSSREERGYPREGDTGSDKGKP